MISPDAFGLSGWTAYRVVPALISPLENEPVLRKELDHFRASLQLPCDDDNAS